MVNPPRKTVAVLGAFDTWPYMNFIAELTAENDCIVHTSRFVYAKDRNTGIIHREPFEIDINTPMIEFLQRNLIAKSDMVIIIYSVSAGHYNEAHWCSEQKKPTLGIALVRGIRVTGIGEEEIDNCIKLHVSADSYSACSAISPWTAWSCINSEPCPFKKQGISLNQIEYFITNNKFMSLFAVDRIQEIENLVIPFLNGTLQRPRSQSI